MKNIDNVIYKLNESIKNMFSDFKGVYLYGSYAKEKAKEYSDVDLVALFEKELPREKRMELWGLIGSFEAELDIVFDFHPMTMEGLKKNPIYYNQVVNKGIYYGV